MYSLNEIKLNIQQVFNSSIGATTEILFSLPLVPQFDSSCTQFLNFFIGYFFVRHTVSPYTNLLQNNTNEDENILSETSVTGPYINLTRDNTTENENVIQHQPTTPRHPSQITNDSTESVPDTLTNPPNTSEIVTDSNALQIPTRNIIKHNNHLLNQETLLHYL